MVTKHRPRSRSIVMQNNDYHHVKSKSTENSKNKSKVKQLKSSTWLEHRQTSIKDLLCASQAGFLFNTLILSNTALKSRFEYKKRITQHKSHCLGCSLVGSQTRLTSPYRVRLGQVPNPSNRRQTLPLLPFTALKTNNHSATEHR